MPFIVTLGKHALNRNKPVPVEKALRHTDIAAAERSRDRYLARHPGAKLKIVPIDIPPLDLTPIGLPATPKKAGRQPAVARALQPGDQLTDDYGKATIMAIVGRWIMLRRGGPSTPFVINANTVGPGQQWLVAHWTA